MVEKNHTRDPRYQDTVNELEKNRRQKKLPPGVYGPFVGADGNLEGVYRNKGDSLVVHPLVEKQKGKKKKK